MNLIRFVIVFLIMFTGLFAGISFAENTAPFKVAAIEWNPQFLQFETNLPRIASITEEAAKEGAKLIVLPEMVTSGYIYKDRAQINPYLDTIPGKTTDTLIPIAKQYHTYIAVGIAEVDPHTQLAYNSAALIGPEGYIGKYRKNQLNSADTRWATRGNLGFPVFDTEIGKIALVICFDDSYIQSLLIPAVRGANIIAYLTSSDRLLNTEPGSRFNHSTIANVTTLSGWVGTYVVGTSRTDNESNPATGITTHYVGGASIWDPNGRNLAQAPVSPVDNPLQPTTIYAMVDPKLYDNPAKQILAERRPELYQILNLYREPINPEASVQPHQIDAIILQYTPVDGDKKSNLQKIKSLLASAAQKSSFNLIVLPEDSLLGILPPQQLKNMAEDLNGYTVQNFVSLARVYHAYVVFSLPQKESGKYFSSAVLVDPDGHIASVYHKTHLNTDEKTWAEAGNSIASVRTAIGRIGLMIGDEVRFPDFAAVFAADRADVIAIPSSWYGQYAGPVLTDPGLLVKPYPSNTMFMWYNMGKYSQAYILAANYVGGKQKYLGSSGLYSLDPVEAHYVPQLAPAASETAFTVNFTTLGSPDWWINQDYLVIGQRVDLNAPLTLSADSSCFLDWKNQGDKNVFCWNSATH